MVSGSTKAASTSKVLLGYVETIAECYTFSHAGVNDGSTHLLGIVKALGEYLTSTKDDVRLKGEQPARETARHQLSSP